MTIKQWLGVGVAVALLSGCGAMPYQPAPNEVMAPVRFLGLGRPLMCKDGKVYSLNAVDNSNVVKVPVGQRISFGASIRSEGYNVVYTCGAWLGFVPEAGRSYIANSGLAGGGRCFTELVREDAAKDTGVSVEPSIRPSACAAPVAAAVTASAPR
ncbi:MAG: hypothetical protein Tsb007_13910 [Rhizobacter sp.]